MYDIIVFENFRFRPSTRTVNDLSKRALPSTKKIDAPYEN